MESHPPLTGFGRCLYNKSNIDDNIIDIQSKEASRYIYVPNSLTLHRTCSAAEDLHFPKIFERSCLKYLHLAPSSCTCSSSRPHK